MFGGNDNTGKGSMHLFAFDADMHTWTHVPTIGNVPDARDEHTATIFGDSMVIFGGF